MNHRHRPRKQHSAQLPPGNHDHCRAHGAVGFTNLLVTREDGAIVLNPHLANCCVLRLDAQAAIALHSVLGEWLG
jgi:hypothetical protein